MQYKVTIKKIVYVDADTPDEAEALALDGNDLFGAEEEVTEVSFAGNAKYYPYGGAE